jgi:hypothetical protein
MDIAMYPDGTSCHPVANTTQLQERDSWERKTTGLPPWSYVFFSDINVSRAGFGLGVALVLLLGT